MRVLVLAIGLVLCMGGSPAAAQAPSGHPLPSAASETSTDGALGLDVEAILSSDEPPIDVAIEQDVAARVSTSIPLEGGVLEADGADGTHYRLTIPADALVVPTEIGMVPLASIGDLPFGGDERRGVQLVPNGLELRQPAILRIEPPRPIPVDQQIPLGFDGDGTGVFLAEPVVDSPDVEIVVTHFSGYIVTTGTLAETGPWAERLGGDTTRRLQSAVSRALGEGRGRQFATGTFVEPMTLVPELEKAFDEYEEVVKLRLLTAGASCANANLAIQTLREADHQRQLVTLPRSALWSEYPGLLATRSRVCTKEEYELCRDHHVVHRIADVIIGFRRERELEGIVDPETSAIEDDYADKCLRFRLNFESNIDVGGGGFSLKPAVRAEVELRLTDAELFTVGGSAPMEMFRLKVTVPKCRSREHPDDDILTVSKLGWTVAKTIWQPERGRIEDFQLEYAPGRPEESVTLSCPGAHGDLELPFALWFPAYVVVHRDQYERSGQQGVRVSFLAQEAFPIPQIDIPDSYRGTMRLRGWEVQEDRLLGRVTWDQRARGARAFDSGSFELWHQPV